MFLPLDTIYRGQRRERDGVAIVSVSRGKSMERLLMPGPAHNLLHTATGFDWGYPGHGPAVLSTAILLDFTQDSELAIGHYSNFKAAFVQEWHEPRWQISGAEIVAWLQSDGAAISPDSIPGDGARWS